MTKSTPDEPSEPNPCVGASALVNFNLHTAREQRPVPDSSLFHQWLAPDGSPWMLFSRDGRSTLIRYPNVADFLVSADGLDVDAWPAPGNPPEACRQLFISQIRSLAISRAGQLVLHGSAVELGNVAVAFLARSGGGKSTLATSFAKDGHRLIVDDGVHLEARDDGYFALPGIASLRLWEDSEAELVAADSPVAPSAGHTTKRRFLGGGSFVFCDQPRPLARLYLLGDDPDAALSITPLSGHAALLPLLEHTFTLDFDDRKVRARNLEMLARLVTRTPVYRLDFPRSYAALPDVRESIRKHVIDPTNLPG